MKNNYNFKKTKFYSILLCCFLFLTAYSIKAQNLNFTIDTAVDNGTNITETLVSGGDTYVLTIDHPIDIETLDNLGGGDLIFYLGTTTAATAPFNLTLTRNGIAINFNLNSIDYDTLGAGVISLSNQNGDLISNPTNYAVGSGTLNITNTSNANNISEVNIIPGTTNDLVNFGFHNINIDIVQPCVPPVGTAVFASQNCGTGEFFVNVNVTNLGGGSPAIFDGTTTTSVTATGVTNLGPYPIGTPINFTLQHGSDVACNVDLGTVADTCPPPCVSPIGTAVLGAQDCVTGTFNININITDLGSGSPSLFDGTTSVPIAAIGSFTVGPYVIGTQVALTLQHGIDTTCDVSLGTVSDTCSEVIFTIDTAVDNVTNITETIVKDGDTYVLTVDHPGSETLDVLNGTDLVFYLGSGGANTIEPFVLTITRNGYPTNFTFKGLDYDTLEAGTISVTNQDNAYISTPTAYPLGSGAIAITSTTNATNISSFNIVPNDADDLIDFGFHNIKVDIVDTCGPPMATAVVSSQDCTTGEFFVEVNVTDLGNGNPSISDGATVTPVLTTGVVAFGPYPIGTPINFTLQHGTDAGCNVDLGAIEDTCPPPVNDECTGAIAVTCGDTVIGTTLRATNSGNDAATDVFYSFTDTVLQDVTLSLCNSSFNTVIRVFDDCLQTNQVTFNDQFCANQSQVTFTAQPNITYYIMIDGFLSTSVGSYELNVSCVPTVPAPGNDLCASATPLSFGVTLFGETTAGATDDSTSNLDDTTCDSFNFHSDVWYTFQALGSGQATITTVITGDSNQANVAVYSSLDCSQLDADSIACSVNNGGETVELTGLIPNAVYYIRVWSDGVAPVAIARRVEGTFNITVSDATLSTPGIDDNSFSYFPNPVDDVLTLNSRENISEIKVYNMLGQVVMSQTPNVATRNLNMSRLESGAYFVKVSIGSSSKLIRVIKN
ncbi:T9SS type A sorting domain-containing protein [uncultured Winogradskyella sp.]|uniref:T9SS type A sorting domain-containing protein n=1 Tax=uncultured Winogradskyella sp. TaxID=395353 RepID=UPI0030D83590